VRQNRPGHRPRRHGRRPGPTPTHGAEAPRQKVPIDLPRQPHQRMAKVDDLLEKRAKQVVLAIVARLAHRSPPTANLALEGITDHPNREIPNRKKTGMHTRLSCKIDYLLRSNHRDRSIASSFFTDDYLARLFAYTGLLVFWGRDARVVVVFGVANLVRFRRQARALYCLLETLRTLSAGTASASSWPSNKIAITSPLSPSSL